MRFRGLLCSRNFSVDVVTRIYTYKVWTMRPTNALLLSRQRKHHFDYSRHQKLKMCLRYVKCGLPCYYLTVNPWRFIVNQVVKIGVRSIFELIKGSRAQYPDLCVKAVSALLTLLEGLELEALSDEPTEVISEFQDATLQNFCSFYCWRTLINSCFPVPRWYI